MKIFIDSANTDHIRQAAAMGIIDGVTTNPSLIAQSRKPFRQLIEEITTIIDGPISAEVLSVTAPEIIAEGTAIAQWHKNIVIKVPLIPEGLKAVRHFASQGIPTNVTLCFSSNQALLAAKAGATYISPFVGRLDDIGHDGMDLIAQIRTIYDNYGFTTEILTASVRSPQHFLRAATLGSDVITAPWPVLQQIIQHPLTDSGLQKFLSDWNKAQK
jgi:transaldolase